MAWFGERKVGGDGANFNGGRRQLGKSKSNPLHLRAGKVVTVFVSGKQERTETITKGGSGANDVKHLQKTG